MADATYTPKTYRKQGGDEFVVASGGKIKIETGGAIVGNAGTQAAFVADVATTGNYADDDNAIVAAINSLKTALVGAGIMAAS